MTMVVVVVQDEGICWLYVDPNLFLSSAHGRRGAASKVADGR